MANFTVRTDNSRFDSPGWGGGNNFTSIPKSTVSFTRYSDQTVVYCNHPEMVGQSNFGDSANSKYLNRVTINTPHFSVYASYDTNYSGTCKLAVRAWNPNNNNITLTLQNKGFNSKKKDANGWNVACDAFSRYFNTITPTSHTLLPNSGTWIIAEDVVASGLCELLASFTTTGTVVVAVYLCTNVANIPGTTFEVAQNNALEYSGKTNSSFIETSHSMRASDLFVSYYNSVFFGLSQSRFSGNANERTDVTLHQSPNPVASEYSPTAWLQNIGNWGLQYQFHTTLSNNTGNVVKFKGYILSNPSGHCAGIQSGGIGVGKFLGTQYVPGNHMRWNFCETASIASGNSITLDYQYMHLSKGNAPCIMQWEVVNI